MRIQNKYLRNRHFRIKHWKRVRAEEHPFKTLCPYLGWLIEFIAEEQIRRNFEAITQLARRIENGSRIVSMRSAPKAYRQSLNSRRKAKERAALAKVNNGRDDIEFPKFKRDAAWLYW